MNIAKRDNEIVASFVAEMIDRIRFFSKGRIPEPIIPYLAEYEVNRLDFNSTEQMHKGIGYYAMMAVNRYLREFN